MIGYRRDTTSAPTRGCMSASSRTSSAFAYNTPGTSWTVITERRCRSRTVPRSRRKASARRTGPLGSALVTPVLGRTNPTLRWLRRETASIEATSCAAEISRGTASARAKPANTTTKHRAQLFLGAIVVMATIVGCPTSGPSRNAAMVTAAEARARAAGRPKGQARDLRAATPNPPLAEAPLPSGLRVRVA